MTSDPVLVTGGSGFVGSHVVLALLAKGYSVRTTVRSLSKEAQVRSAVLSRGTSDEKLSFAVADLESDNGWKDAVAGCAFVHHVASPFPLAEPDDEQDLIRPAYEGTLRVLRAATAAGVRRVVLTSSFAAIGFGQGQRDTPYTEADWTSLDGDNVGAYLKSKTLAERAAWDFIASKGGDLELAVVNPVGIFGPALNNNVSSSLTFIRDMLAGKLSEAPRLYMGVVDVRDVADIHLRAMSAPEAAGERFLAVAGKAMSLFEMAILLRASLGEAATKVPRQEILNEAGSQVDIVAEASNMKARNLLGWTPRSNEEAILASAESLLNLGLVPAPEG